MNKNPELFRNEDDAMVELGIGKNMVRSMKFWADAARVIVSDKQGKSGVTDFGRELLLGTGPTAGLDPFLEDLQTLWLIHWNISTVKESPLFGWDFLMNRWQDPYLSLSRVRDAFVKATVHRERAPSAQTLEQMYEVFVHT